MKKVLVFVLAVVMIMSMAVPAAALASPSAGREDLLPGVKEHAFVRLYTPEEVQELLHEAIQKLMAEAKEKLKDACPEGFAVKYFFYADVIGSEGPLSVELDPIEHSEIIFKQYIDGEWMDRAFTVEADGVITVHGIVDAPFAIFTK